VLNVNLRLILENNVFSIFLCKQNGNFMNSKTGDLLPLVYNSAFGVKQRRTIVKRGILLSLVLCPDECTETSMYYFVFFEKACR